MTSDIDWNSVYHAYYIEKRNIDPIVKKFGLKVTTAIFKGFPPYTHPELFCEICNSPLISDFLNKSASLAHVNYDFDLFKHELSKVDIPSKLDTHNQYYLSRTGSAIKTEENYRVSIPYCPKCNHSPTKSCKCTHCLESTNSTLQVILDSIRALYEVRHTPQLNYNNLSPRQLYIAIYTLVYGISELNGNIRLCAIGETTIEKEILDTNIFSLDVKSVERAVTMKSLYEYSLDEGSYDYVVSNGISTANTLKDLNFYAKQCVIYPEMLEDLVNLWLAIALDEALDVLRYYCAVYGLEFRPGEKTISSIQRSLKKYGLAQSATYIKFSVTKAHNFGKENNFNGRHSFNLIYNNLNFWLDDERARTYNALPSTRTIEVLAEPRSAIVFSNSFFGNNDIDYFSDCIGKNSISSAFANS